MPLYQTMEFYRELPVFILLLIFIAAVISVSYFSAKRREAALRRLSDVLPGKIAEFSVYPRYEGEYQGSKVSIVLVAANKSSPSYLRIILERSSPFKMTIRKESAVSDIGKKIGLVHEVTVMEEAFDKEFLVLSDSKERAMLYINNAHIKDIVRELFSAGFTSIAIDGKRLSVEKPDYTIEKDLSPDNVVAILQKICALTNGL